MACDALLITGFLGAGKTTLLLHILKWPGDLSGTAILVNEFGKIGIDGQLLEGFDTPVTELANGCICCSMKSDLVGSLEDILTAINPKRLFIEATGVADPFEISDVLNSFVSENRISSLKTVTVLDGDLWEGREYFGPVFYNQIKAADVLLLNKVDLLPPENVPDYMTQIREINDSCAIIPTHHCEIDPDALFEPVVKDTAAVKIHIPHFQSLIDKPDRVQPTSSAQMGYVGFSFESDNAVNRTCFHQFIGNMPINLHRMKGYVRMENKTYFINHTGGRTDWKEVEIPNMSTRLAFVGWKVSESEIVAALESCLEKG